MKFFHPMRFICFLLLGAVFINVTTKAAFAANPVILDEVVLEGNRRIPEGRITPYLIKKGEEFTMQALDESIKKLYQTGLFLNIDGDLYVKDDKFVLKYVVEEMPLVGSVIFNGNKEVKTKTLREKVTLKTGQALNFTSVEKAIEALRTEYEDGNRYGTKIEFRIEARTINSVDVIFDITESDKAKIYNVWLYGNDNVSRNDILKAIPTKERGFWTLITSSGKVSKEMVAADAEMIRMMYLERGYAKVAVGEPGVAVQEEYKDRLNMTVRIREGDQFFVRSVDIAGNGNVEADKVWKEIQLKKGDVFNIRKYQDDITNITELYTSSGYAYANVEPIISLDDETREVDIVYKIEQNILVNVGRITITGNKTTYDHVIRRQIDQMEGALYNSTLIREAKANTMATGYFSNVQIIEKADGKDTINLDVNVAEQSTGTFTVGAAYSTVDGIMGMVQLARNNFMGWGHDVSVRAEISQKRMDFSFSYTDPWLFDWPVSAGLDIYNLQREWYEYTRNTLGGSIRLGHSLIKRRLYMNYRFSIYTVRIFDIDNEASKYIKAQKGFTTTHSLSPSIIWNNLNNAVEPTSGNKTQIYVDLAGSFLGGEAHFLKVGGDSTQYFPLFLNGDITLMLHIEAGYIMPLKKNSPIPIDERFRLGGINSIRGFDYGEISPKDDEGYEYGGDKYYQGNVEIHFPLKKDIRLKGIVFFDIGQVFSEREAFFSVAPRKTAGIGVRWFTPMGPFRLEWGYKLDRKPGESPYKFEFSIGGTF